MSAPAKLWRHCSRLCAAALRALAIQRAWRGGGRRMRVFEMCAWLYARLRWLWGLQAPQSHGGVMRIGCSTAAPIAFHCSVQLARARQPLLVHTSRQSSLPNKTLPARHLLPSLRLHAISPRPFSRQRHGAWAGTGAFRLLGRTAREGDLEGGRGLGGGCSAAQGLAPIVHEGRRTHQRTQFTQ